MQPADLWQGGKVEALSKAQLGALLDGPRDKDTFVALYAPWCQFCKVRAGRAGLGCAALGCAERDPTSEVVVGVWGGVRRQ